MRNLFIATLIVVLLTSCSEPARDDSTHYDLIIRGGTLVDGSGSPAYRGDLALIGDEIAAVGNLSGSRATQEIDARGLIVAPGFINIHSHAQADSVATAVNMLSQGVTTEIINADGRSELDVLAQLANFASDGLAVNIGGMIGFNSVWQEVNGNADTRPSAEQLEQMQNLIRQGLEDGAWGVSAGLDYVPGYYATTDEVITVLEPFGDWNVPFANHDRVTPESGFSSIAGMSETLEIGVATGLIPLVTHMKVQGWEQGQAAVILERMRRADTSFTGGAIADFYPYLAGQTGLGSLIIPTWAMSGGREAMLERFSQPDLRAQIIEEAENRMRLRFGGPEGVYLLQSGRQLTQAMEEMELDSSGETVIRLLEESNQSIIARFGDEADLIAIMQHPTASVSCDCGASISDRVHPRFWGTNPRILGRYVREQGVLTMEEAIYKMTHLPARQIGMLDRGLLIPGMKADVVVFDPDTVIDHATYDNPTQISEGIVHTLVNGEFAWRDGAATGVVAGVTLVRE